MAIQQYRIVRLVMVLVIVALTIFLYVSYYANSAMTIPGRPHSSATLLTVINSDNNDLIKIIDNNNIDQSESAPVADVLTKGKNVKNNFPNMAGPEDVNSSYAQQYSDVLASSVQPNPSISKLKTLNKNVEKASQRAPTNFTSQSPAVSVAIPAKLSPHGPIDPSKGVRTGDLYESGHLEPNSELCPDLGESLRLLILITSAPTHQDARLSIRQTWGHYGRRRDIAIGFILGSTSSQAIEDALAAESYMYSDMIRGRFVDSYNNLTLKTISSLEWIDNYCSKVKFILKTDDDMFINIPRLLNFIEKHQQDTRIIYGRLAKKWKPIRNKKSKYYVSPQQYFPPVFPQFTTGPAYLMTGDMVHGLYTKSLNQTYLKLEDVFTTGIVAQLLNVKRVHVNEFLNRRIAFNPCNIRKAISVHMVKSNEQFDLWKKLLDISTKCK